MFDTLTAAREIDSRFSRPEAGLRWVKAIHWRCNRGGAGRAHCLRGAGGRGMTLWARDRPVRFAIRP